MRRKILPKLLSCVIIALLGFSNNAISQTPDYVNSTLYSFYPYNSFPFRTSTTYSKCENISLAGEFVNATPGMMDAVYYRRGNTSAATTFNSLTVEVKLSSVTSFSGNTYSGGIVARSSTLVAPSGSAGDWFKIPLTTPLLFDPTKSVSITSSHNGYSGGGIGVYTGYDCSPGIRRRYGSWGASTSLGSDCSWYEMGIDVSPILGTDLVAFSLPKPNIKCGETNAPFSISLLNIGEDSVFDVPLTMEVTGTVAGSPYNQTYTTTYTDTIKSFEQKEVTFPNTLNTMSGANLNLKAYFNLAADTTNNNDTIETSRVIYGLPSAPTTTDQEVCGGQEIFLQASSPGANEEIIWTKSMDGKGYVGEGNNASTGFLFPGTYKYYAHIGRGFDRSTSTNVGGFNYIVTTTYSNPNGGIFKVTADDRGMIIDSVGAYLYLTTFTDYEVYFKYDSYVGYESDPGAWELVAKGSGAYTGGSAGMDYFQLDKPVILKKGETGSFYVSVTGNTVYLNAGSKTSSDDFVTMESTPAMGSLFGSPINGYALNSGIKYKMYCNSNATEVTIKVKEKPYGSQATKGAPFVGFYLAGTPAKPDVMADGDTISYSYDPPTNFNNSDFGSTWDITNFEAVTLNGTTVPNTYYTFTNPSGANNANLEFYPDTNWADSTIEFQMLVKNLDPNNLCDSLVKRAVFLAPRPEPNFEAAGQCAGDAVEFKNTSTIKSGNMRYVWDFGDSEMATLTNPIHVYKNPGTYNVSLEATNDWGYKETYTTTVTIKEKPDIKFRPINACEGTAVQFENNTSITSGAPISYEWTFGDGSAKDLTKSPSHLYANSGEYSVTLVAEAAGCVSVTKRNAFQFPQPVAEFEVTNDECNVTSEVVFTNKSTISSGRLGSLWNYGDLSYSTQTNSTHNFTDAGVHDVQLKVQSAFGCSDSTTKQIVLKESPIASFDNSQTCDIDPVDFTNTSFEPTGTNVDYTWDFGDPTSPDNNSNLKNPNHQYSLPGARKVTLTVLADNGCSDEVTKDIVIGVQPQADFDVELVCEGEEVVFVNKTIISRGDIEVTYDWDFDDNETSTEVSPTKSFVSPGVYSVSVVATAKDGGCTDTETKDITVYETPDCDFNAETNGSGDRRFNYTITNKPIDGSTIEWNFGDGGFSYDENPQWQYSFDGGFYVTLRITSPAGCDCETRKRVNVFKNSVGDVDFDNNVSVYPNPSAGVFTVELTNITANTTVTVYNALGQQINADITTNADNKYTVNIADQPTGVYTVKVQSGSSVYTTKITITK